MLEQLLNHIHRHTLCKTTDKILLAVSGGLDSMVMFHLMRQAGYQIAVVHCNFQLRGAEALDDEQFVRAVCQQHNIPFFVKRFATADYAAEHGISIQMAARDLRYQYFRELMDAEGYDLVATGHHHSDVVESVLMNLIRGTGIDGFRGILAKKENVIRPLLFATRRMIQGYAHDEKITWQEDASNLSDDYQRNFLRRQVIPRIEEINFRFEEGFRDTRDRLLGARDLMLQQLAAFREAGVEVRDGRQTLVEIRRVAQSPAPAVLLWELIKDWGFKFDQCRKIVEAHQPGKMFHTSSHQLLVDRTHYIIEQKQASEFVSTSIEEGQEWAGQPPLTLSIRTVSAGSFQLDKNPSIAQLDADRLRFPLVWRKWQAGDYFVPLGMHQEKKVSDFLIDLKIPFNSKADVTVLESGKDIVWIAGFRINDRYKVTSTTRRVLILELKAGSDEKTVS